MPCCTDRLSLMASTYGSVSTVKYERKDIVDPLMALVVFSLLGRKLDGQHDQNFTDVRRDCCEV